MRILIIDDHREAAEALCKLLHERMDPTEAVKCEITGTLAEGKRISHSFQPEVTTLDVCLPDATEQEVLEAIKDLVEPVIVVSGKIEDDVVLAAKCWAYGAKGVQSKRGLLEKIQTLDGIIQKALFIAAITGSHLRATAPAQLAELKHGTTSP